MTQSSQQTCTTRPWQRKKLRAASHSSFGRLPPRSRTLSYALPMPSEEPESASVQVVTPSAATTVALNGATEALATAQGEWKLRQRGRSRSRSRSNSHVPVHRMECVRVSKKLRRDGHTYYVASVYLHRRSERLRLSDCVYSPTAASTFSKDAMREFMMSEREPDFSVEHRFSDFLRLRAQIGALVKPHAHTMACATCQECVRFLLDRQHQAWALKHAFSTTKTRFALLESFLNDLLMLTTGAEKRSSSNDSSEDVVEADDVCNVREKVAELAQEFLKRSYQPSLGII